MSLIGSFVCFVVCHAGPADHFAVFAEELARRGHKTEIYATGPALAKLQGRCTVIPFSVDSDVDELARKCSSASAVITDVGHPFDASFHQTLAQKFPQVKRWAYYDNLESHVPGGYSSVAANVMLAADGVLFANAHLSQAPVYQAPSEEVALTGERIGIGYYPISQAAQLAKRRGQERKALRSEVFSRYSIRGNPQVWVYMGGNNSEYFEKALPAFLRLIDEATQKKNLSDCVVFLQQHPGAKGENRDRYLIEQWLLKPNERRPRVFISDRGSDEAQVMADRLFYYQTSMAPQFVMAGIPTAQIGHETYHDVMVKNGLCPSVIDADGLLTALAELKAAELTSDMVYDRLGMASDWADRLEKTLFTK